MDDWITEAAVIFRGRLISREPLESVETTPVSRLNDLWTDIHTFEVLEVLKGDLGETVRIYEPHGVYGSSIRPGQILLVFAERARIGRLVIANCGHPEEDIDGARTRYVAERLGQTRPD